MAIAIGNRTVSNSTPGVTTRVVSHNHNTGSDGVLLVALCMSNNRNYNSVSYNGVSMTQRLNYASGGSGQRWAFFELANPATGVNTLIVNFDGSVFNPLSLIVQSFTGALVGGNVGNNDLSTTPHSRNFTISENSIIYMTGVSSNAQSSDYVINGSNRPALFTHNTNRQVRGVLSTTGLGAGSISCITKADFGQITNTRIEIKEAVSATITNTGNFLLMF